MKSASSNEQVDEAIIQIVREEKPNTVKDLVYLVKERFQLSDEHVTGRILRLKESGKISIRLKESRPEALTAYLATSEANWYWVVLATALIGTLTIFLIPESADPFVYARYVFGAIFVLWLPGYTFVKVLFPGRELDSIERIALSFGLSLALILPVGLLLNYSPWGLRLVPITLSLCILALVFATAAILRDYQTKKV